MVIYFSSPFGGQIAPLDLFLQAQFPLHSGRILGGCPRALICPREVEKREQRMRQCGATHPE